MPPSPRPWWLAGLCQGGTRNPLKPPSRDPRALWYNLTVLMMHSSGSRRQAVEVHVK